MDLGKECEYYPLGEIPHWTPLNNEGKKDGLRSDLLTSESRNSFFSLRGISSVVTASNGGLVHGKSLERDSLSFSDDIPDVPLTVDSKYSSSVLPDRSSLSQSMASLHAKYDQKQSLSHSRCDPHIVSTVKVPDDISLSETSEYEKK